MGSSSQQTVLLAETGFVRTADTVSIGLLKLKDVKGIDPTACNINLMRNSPSQGDFCRKMAGRFEEYILQNIPMLHHVGTYTTILHMF